MNDKEGKHQRRLIKNMCNEMNQRMGYIKRTSYLDLKMASEICKIVKPGNNS
jgi:hypothetical protein